MRFKRAERLVNMHDDILASLVSGPSIDCVSIAIPTESWTVIRPESAQQDLDELRRYRFDQGPVLLDGECVGLIWTEELAAILARGETLEARTPVIRSSQVGRRAHVEELLQTLSVHRAVLVDDHAVPVGMITISDLNSHGFRSVLYPLIAELEILLADLISIQFPDDHMGWIQHLSEHSQIQVLGSWHLATETSTEIHPTSAASLPDLLTVFLKCAWLREQLHSFSNSELQSLVEGMRKFRNSLMHPARPLATNTDDVRRLHGRLVQLRRLAQDLREYIGLTRGPQSGPKTQETR